MAAYIDEYRNRFKVGPICRVLSESLGCGFLAPRGYRMVESRPVSRMRARHEALARGVMGIHAGGFSVFLVKSVFRVSSLIFFGFRHEECRPVVCFTGCPSCRT